MKKRLTALLLIFALVISMAPQVFAESIEDYPNGVNVLINGETPHTYLDIKSGEYSWGLSARIWSYLTADGKIKGPAYCTSHESGYPNGYIAVDTTPYTANPAMTGAFSSGYPLVSLETFTALHPEVSGLTKDEYGYATQVAIWAALGQVAVEGTAYTSGAETVFRPEDAAKLRVYNAVVAILSSAGSGGTSVGMRIRDAAGSDSDTVDLGSGLSLSDAALTNIGGIKTETIGGKQYYTREFVLTCTSMPDSGSVTLQVSGAPAGTVLASASNQVLNDGAVTLTASGTEYSGTFKVCVPAEAAEAETSGSITVQAAAAVASCTFYKVDNSHAYEQDFIIADPNSSTSSAAGYLKWGESGTTTTDTGSIRLLKTGENGEALAGAEFDIDGSAGYHNSGTTGADGSITWTDLPVGQGYTITETLAPEGFQLSEPISVAAKAGQTVYVTVTDSSEKTFRIHKQDKQSGFSLEGALFRFEQIDGDFVTEGRTKADGLIEFTPDKLPYGAYRVFELSAPEGYEKDNDVKTVNWDGKADIDLYFTNVRKAGFKILKVDSLTNLPLSGAYFDIYKDGALIDTVRTNEQGIAIVSGVSEGYYECVERIAPYGYVLSSKKFGIHVDPYDPAISEDPVLRIPNKRMPALRIVKYDAQTMQPLANVTFAVYKDTELIGEYPTDNRGEIYLYDLEPGTYTVQEIAGPDSHVVNSTPQSIELEAGTTQTYTLIFFNYLKPGIHLRKVDSQTLEPLPNVRFRITQVGGTFSQEYTTDPNGEIDLSGLEPGTYTVVELAGPDGYLIDDAERIIKIEGGDNAEFIFTNTRKPSFRLVKIDSLTGERLPGATFRIARIADGSHYLDRVTDIDGEINISDLEPGVYSVQELAVPDKYVLDTTEYHVELFPGQTSQIVISNDVKPDLIIRKTDKDTGEPVPGVTFTLQGADGPTITTEATGPDGTVKISNLLPGVYTVTEQSVPENYILDTTPQTVTLFANRVATVQFQNYQRPTLKIAKVDINGKSLTGAIFEVKTKAGVKIGDFPVGADGTITIPQKQLDEGYYIITEKQAPEGYILDTTPHEVYLRPGKTTEISIENEKKPGLTIYKIDSVVGDGIKGAKFKIYVSKDKTENGTYQELDSSFYYSDENGVIHLDNLDTGWYKIVEVEPAAGFSMKEPHEQIIYVEHDKAVEVTFENTPLNAIVVEKYDSVTHEALPGCTFQLRYLAGTSGTGGTVIGTKVTSKNGIAMWTGLKPGAYVVEEVDPADGYSIINSSETVYLADSGEQSVITVIFTNSPDGSLLIRKVCAVNPSTTLQDAEFKITYSDGALIGDSNGIYCTDVNGEILIDGLKPGKSVVVTETKAPDGFIIDTQSQTIQIKEGRTVSLTFKNQPKGGIIVQKRDSITGQPLPGAQFRITTAAGCEVGLDGVIGSSTLTQNGIFTTDAQGEIRISNLAPGAYVLTEVKAPAGYVMDSPSTNVVIGANGDTQTVIITNTPKGGLIVEKYDSVTKQPLPGAEFKIVYANGELLADNESLTSSNGLYTTDRNGQIVLSKVTPGTLVVTETKAPNNYQTDPNPQTVVVNAGDTQTLRFYDDPLCTLTILKRDAVTRKPLANATFVVRDSEGRAIGPNNGLYTTGTDGTVTVTGLTPNATIVVSETKAPTGYVLDETPKNIVVRSGVANSLIFDNQPGTTLVIRKYIEGTDYEPLVGVCFKVTDGSGAAVGPDDGTYYTDKAGEIVLDGIEPGTTVIAREIKTVEGFVLDGTPQDILIKGGEVQRLTFWNKRAGTLVVQKKDSVTGALIAGAQFQLTYANGGYVDNDNGHLSSNGLYTTDAQGEIRISGITGTVVVKEVQAAPGYVIDSSTQMQTVTVNPEDTQTLVFLNEPLCSLTITKLDSVTGKPVPGTVFKVTDGNGNLIGTYTTGADGTVTVTGLIPGSTVVVSEIKVPDGYVLDPTPQTITVKNGANTVTNGSSANGTGTGTGSGSNGNGLTFENDPTTTLIIEKYIEGTTTPLKGVTFLVTDSSGSVVGSSNGEYITDENGRIVIKDLEPGTTVTAREVKTLEGYVLDTTPKTIQIKVGEAQTLRFYNTPVGGLELIKVDAADKTKRIANTTFEIRRTDGGLVETVTTDRTGRVHVDLDAGNYYAVEIEAAQGYRLDSTPAYFTVTDGKTTTVTVTNNAFSGILIHKTNANTGNGISGVTFLLYDSGNNPIGQYTTDNQGYARIEGIDAGRYFLRELENTGYVPDTEMKTVEVRSGETTLVEWKNIPISAQIQITKKSADYNPTNGLPAGTLLEGAVFEIYDKANNLVDTIQSDSRGLAVSKPLPLGRYTIREVKAPANYGISGEDLTAYLEHEGQIVRFEVMDKSLNVGVSITKTGPKEIMAGNPVNYSFSGIGNTSNVRLDSFYFRDTLPAEVRLDTVVTGTWNFPGTYKITYRVNGGEYRTLADNLSTSKNYKLAASPVALGLASNERVTEIMFVFGQAPAGFAQVEKPYLYCTAAASIASTSFVNVADVGGVYNGQWIQAVSRWVTEVYGKPVTLPRTGY